MRRAPSLLTLILVATFARGAAGAEGAREGRGYSDEGERPRPLALEISPLGFVIGRFGGNVEYMIAEHHAAMLSPHVMYALPGRDDELHGFGVELGYRHYFTGDIAPQGPFVGAALLVGSYRYVDREATSDAPLRPECTQVRADLRACQLAYYSYGLALDAGWQLRLRSVVVGPGVGVQYTYFTDEPHYETQSGADHALFWGSGLRPRVLFSVGGVF